jgi:hypothetical protein
MPEPVAAGGAHVVHADRRDAFDAGIDLGRTDDEAAGRGSSDEVTAALQPAPLAVLRRSLAGVTGIDSAFIFGS